MRFKSNSTVGPPGLPVRIRTALLASPIIGPLLAKIFYHPLSREVLHEYWRRPSDGVNLPENYAGPKERSAFLVRIVSRYAKPDARILEIGCNVGRNLEYLFRVGFREGLTGIEISEEAVALMKETFPEMAANARIYNSPAEDIVETLEDQSFDLVFTMAVLEHIHTSSEWLFHEIVRITRQYLVTIEDERGYNGRHFPRNYREIFEALGLHQLEEISCKEVEGLGKTFTARIFTRSTGPTALDGSQSDRTNAATGLDV